MLFFTKPNVLLLQETCLTSAYSPLPMEMSFLPAEAPPSRLLQPVSGSFTVNTQVNCISVAIGMFSIKGPGKVG